MKLRAEDHPTVFWDFNDRLTKAAIANKVDSMARNGVRSFLIHPLPDSFRKEDFFAAMTTPYLSPSYFEGIRTAVEKASQRGMEVWLYDEGGWPSGRANGLIAKEWPHLKAHVMTPGGLTVVTPERTDLLNPETTQRFIEITHERYREAVGEHFGKTIPGFFTDEPDVPGQVGTARLPWTADMPDAFEARTGKPLIPLLPFLFGKGRTKEADEARIAFAKVWTDLFQERFFTVLREYCHRHSLLLVGHLLGDQSMRAHARCGGDFYKLIRALDEPGLDVIWGQIDSRHPRSFFPTYATSALCRRGQRCWSETGAAYGFGMTIQELKTISDHQLVQGVNKFAPMKVSLSKKGPRWVQIATRLLDDAPDAAHYRDLDLYLAESSRQIRESELFRPVEVPYPIESLWSRQGKTDSNRLNRLAGRLSDRNIGFRFETSAREWDSEKLEQAFHKAWPWKRRLTASPRIRWVAMQSPDGAWAFCVNHGSRTGEVRLQPGNLIWKLAPGESRFISLEQPEPDPIFRTARILREWELRPIEEWVLGEEGPEPMPVEGGWKKLETLGSWCRTLGPYFSGRVCYRTRFLWHGENPAPLLDLGRVSYAAICRLNGKPLGRAAWAPFRFPLSGLLVEGENELEVEVSGSLANLMLAPETQQTIKRQGLWNVYLERSLPLEKQRLESGLHGPVRLLNIK